MSLLGSRLAPRLTIAAVALCSYGAAATTYAQNPAASEPPTHVGVTEGAATIDRDTDSFTAAPGEPLVPGDRLRTEEGRTEIWFADGSTLALDVQSDIELHSATLIRLTSGRLHLTVTPLRPDHTGDPVPYRVDTPLGSIAIDSAGEHSVALFQSGQDESLELSVIRGSAELTTDAGDVVVQSGERTFARAQGPPSYPERFNSARQGDFERWVASLRDARRGRSTSSQHLPPNLRMYGGVLDRDGSWEYEAAYGYVWYPVVDAGWRPYYQGVWRPLPQYGWTWIATDRWGWPTHHYGRWGYGRSRWFWIPERRWAPAWVTWASATDYVGWCPLGFDDRPVFGFSLSAASTWAGWVVLPRRSFRARHVVVSRDAFDVRRLPRRTAFDLRTQSPVPPPALRARPEGTDDPPDDVTRARIHGPGGPTDRRAGERVAAPMAADGSSGPRDHRDSASAAPDNAWTVPWSGTTAVSGGDRYRSRGGDRTIAAPPYAAGGAYDAEQASRRRRGRTNAEPPRPDVAPPSPAHRRPDGSGAAVTPPPPSTPRSAPSSGWPSRRGRGVERDTGTTGPSSNREPPSTGPAPPPADRAVRRTEPRQDRAEGVRGGRRPAGDGQAGRDRGSSGSGDPAGGARRGRR